MEEYFKMGVSDVQMGDLLKVHYDSNVYGLRYFTYFVIECLFSSVSVQRHHDTAAPETMGYEIDTPAKAD